MMTFEDKIIDRCAKAQHRLATNWYVRSDEYQTLVNKRYAEEKDGVKAAQKIFLMGSVEKRQRITKEIEKDIKKEMEQEAKKQVKEEYQKKKEEESVYPKKIDDDVPHIHFE